jgi:hypothetical protein
VTRNQWHSPLRRWTPLMSNWPIKERLKVIQIPSVPLLFRLFRRGASADTGRWNPLDGSQVSLV